MATLTLTGSNANTLTGTNVSGGTVATTGDDTISASSAQISGSTIDGNGGTDVLQLTGGGAFNLKAAALLNVTSIKLMSSSTVTGTTGADLISGSGAEDTLIGDLGNDTLHGDAHHDVLSGGDGNDSLYGGLNNDTLYGDAGDDTLSGGAHADMLFGGAGNDVFAISSSTDFVAGETIDGGDGTDTILLVSASGLQYDFSGAISIERIEHSGNQDFGITGGANNELIIGGSGRQTLLGGAGEDTISGGAGNDTITGGDGNDVFQFAASGEGNDLITDFAPGDLIRVAGRSSGGSITNGGSTVAANSVQVSTSNGVTTLYVDTDGVADAAELTVLLTGTYLSGDFAFSGADITRNAPVFTTGTDTFTDTSGNALAVGAGVGTINAGDTIDGGDGNDTLAAMLADGETTGAATIAGFDNLNIAVASGQSATFNALNVTDSTLKPNGAGLHVITNASVRVEGAGMTGAGRLDLAFADTISGFYGGIGFGGSNSDTLHGGNGNDTIYGVGGADTLLGEGGNDVLSGGPGNDSMVGGDGADGLSGGDGADTLLGGDGNDTVNFAVAELAGGDSVDGGAGTDTLQLNSGGSFDLSGLSFTNFEVIRGSTAHDTITGNFGSTPYLFEGLNGNDSIVGGGGNDTLSGGGGNDTLSGGAGDDVFSLGTSTGEITASELIDGGTGNDTIWLTSFGSYNLSQPTLNGIESIVVANALSASVTGGAADDSIVGNAAVDLLLGGAGNDTLSGGDGNDTLSGGAGNDLLAGGEGNDLFALAAANIAGSTDTLSGGNGTDAIVLGGAGIYDFSAVEIHGVEQVLGSSGNDGISGLADADVTSAGFLVDGGGGNDTLAGGTGNDTLSGGSGNDVFAFASTGNGTDRIADIAENEIIRVTGRASTGGTVTDGDGSNVAANSVQVSTSGGVTTLYIDTNGAAGAAELTVTLTGTFAARNFALSGTDITHVVPPIFSTGTDNYTDDPGNALTAAAATGTINAGDTVDAGDGTDTLNATLANGETTGPATLTGWENLNLTVASGATATFDAQNVSASTLKPVGAGAHVITNASVSVDASGLTGAGTLNATFTGGNVTAIGGAGRDTLSGGSGADTLSGAAGNDLLYGGDGNDVFGYAATDTGQVDVIGDFAAGDVIRVGSATLGGIASGTGTGLAARGVQVGATSGGFTPLYVDLDGNGGAADLTINLAGSFTADTLRVSNNEISVYTAPPSTGGGGGDNGGGGTTQTVDGVTVQQTTQTASDGTRTETLTVPIITAGRTEENAATPNADIPLARDSGGQDLLTAHVPVGVGLTVESTTTTASGVQGLIRAIQNRTQNQPGDQSAMTGVGQSFLDVLPPTTNLTVRTIVPVVANPAAPPSQPIVITGTAPATGSTQQQAVVIDASSLPSGTVIQLQNVDFAAVVGAVRVTGGEGSQVVAGDSADQWMVLGADDDTLRGGGGNDFVGSEGGDDVLYGDTGLDTVTGGIGNDALYGNQQDDMVYGNQGLDTLFGGQDADTMFGGQDGDVLYGNRAADVLYGQLGSDTLFGGQDSDVLFGGQGDDLLAGNLGSDTLTGGQGADVFRIGAPQEGGDVIADFEAGVDRIAVAGPNFGNIPAGALSASHFALDNPTSAGATFVFNTRTGVLSFDADGAGAGVAVTVATLNVRTLSHTDILVVPN